MDIAEISQHRARKLESIYVHRVYSSQALSFDDLCDEPWPEIKTFLSSLARGSFVADVGCGNGKYLNVRDDIVVNGSDICKELLQLAHGRNRDVIRANSLCLPYRSGSMDAVISVGVLHHFASPQRRLEGVMELARLLRPGGKMLIYVWAWEQKQRKFRAQDVLVPWSKNEIKVCKAENDQGLPNCLKSKKYFSVSTMQKPTKFVTNGCSSSREQDKESIDQLDLPVPNVYTYGDKLPERKETTLFHLSLLKNTVSKTAITIKEKLNLFSPSNATSSGNNSETCVSSTLENHSFYGQKSQERLERIAENKLCHSNSRTSPESDNHYENGLCQDKISQMVEGETCNYTHDSVSSLQFSSFHRFYHVFRKDELLELVKCVPELKVVSQNYDHGNWAVTAEKQSG